MITDAKKYAFTTNRFVLYAWVILSLSLFPFSAKAQISVDATHRDPRQKAVIDEVNYRFTYRTMFSEDTVGRAKYYDNQVLEIGFIYVRYYGSPANFRGRLPKDFT